MLLTSTKRISLPNGDILHGIKASDAGFAGFGEAYFSYIHYGKIKAWRLHKKHTANIVLPLGKVKIQLYQEIVPGISAPGYPKEIILSEHQEDYKRLTIPPGVWYGFEGLANPSSLIFSFLNGEHSPDEQESISIENFPCPWNSSNL